MIALLAAFQFLTIMPPLIKRPFTLPELGRSTIYFPVVGLAIGGLLTGLGIGLGFVLPPLLAAVIILTVWVISTRALHFDGFIDAADGLFGGFTSERRLEIMRDSSVGAFGTAAGALLLLIKFAAIYSLPSFYPGLLLAPVLGRWGITLSIVFFPYAREKGLGRGFKNNARWPHALAASIIAIGTAWFIAQWSGIAVCALTMAVMLAWIEFVRQRIPGLTGDIYGATCEIIEVVTLTFLSLTIIS